MLHFVLEDINPEKVESFDAFLREMNDIAVLTTVASAPFVSSDDLKSDEEGKYKLNLSEDIFDIVFKGEMVSGKVVSGYFEVKDDGKKIVETSFTVRENSAISLRVKLNCEGESLARTELERAFERDFSHEAHQFMKQPLPVDEPINIEAEDEAQNVEDPVSTEGPEMETSANVEENDFVEAVKETTEITEELESLSQKVMDSMIEVRSIIDTLNGLCHDLTRGQTADFSETALNEQTLENGARVLMIDQDSNGYKVTFRKGMLDEMSEVSFFLEKDGELVFSVYLSSTGTGQISAQGENGEITIKRVKDQLI